MSYFLKVGQLDWVEGSRTLGHGYTVSRNGISHVVIIYQVDKRLAFVQFLCFSKFLVRNLTINTVLNVVVFQQVGRYFVDSSPELLKTVVG